MKAAKGQEMARKRLGRGALAFMLGVLLVAAGVVMPLGIGVSVYAGEVSTPAESEVPSKPEGGELYGIMLMSTQSVGDWSEIQNAARNGNVGDVYQLQNDITANSPCTVTGNLTIDLNGHTITAGDGLSGNIFFVNGGTLTIQDSSEGKTGTINNNEKDHSIVKVSAGKFELQGGKLTGTKNADKGGAVYVDGTGEAVISGGEISGNSVTSDGGGVYVQDNGTITITGSAIITGNTAPQGGGAYARGKNSHLIINGGTITVNTATSRGGGVFGYEAGDIQVSGGEISHNTAGSGGGIYLENNSTLTMSGGTVSHNEATDACGGDNWDIKGGGGIFVHGTFKMSGGTVTENTANAAGGVFIDSGSFEMTGGSITNNTAYTGEGGGLRIGQGATGLIKAAEGNKIYITDNKTNTPGDWGGGGIFVADSGGELVIVNALIADNTAGGFGGGLGACSTGHVYYGVGSGETPSPLAAIFGNTADGKNVSGSSSTKNADHFAQESEVFMHSGYQDVFSALETVISGLMLGGGDEAWVGSADGAPVSVGKDGFVSSSQMLGLTSNSTPEDQEKARKAASVFITGNHSNTHGGGIMCNGSLSLGWEAKVDITPGLAIKGTKRYEIKGEQSENVPEFHFVISDKAPGWNGKKRYAVDGSSVLITKNGVDGSFAFDLAFGDTQPCLIKKEGKQTFYFWEENDDIDGVTYDPTYYVVTVNVQKIEETKNVAGATLTVTTWSIVSGSAKVEKWTSAGPDLNVQFEQKIEENGNSHETMTGFSRTVITLQGDAFKNTYSGDSQLSLKKVNEDGEPLQGAKFEIYKKDDSNGEEVAGWEGKWTKLNNQKGFNSPTGTNGIIYQDNKGEDWHNKLGEGIYRLVEIEAPEGFTLIPGYIEFEIKGTGAQRMIYCPFNVLYSEYVTVVDNGLTLQVKNTQPKTTLRIIKVDKGFSERGLPGAEFELYTTKRGDGDELIKDELTWTAKSNDEGQLLWTKNGDTESEGNLDLTLHTGTYYLYETKAPDGFNKLERPITVTVTNEDEVKVTLTSEEVEVLQKEGESVLTFQIPNSSGYQLPESGGSGTVLYVVLGVVLVVGSAALLIAKKRLHRAR